MIFMTELLDAGRDRRIARHKRHVVCIGSVRYRYQGSEYQEGENKLSEDKCFWQVLLVTLIVQPVKETCLATAGGCTVSVILLYLITTYKCNLSNENRTKSKAVLVKQ
jgi:hypothetical protein